MEDSNRWNFISLSQLRRIVYAEIAFIPHYCANVGNKPKLPMKPVVCVTVYIHVILKITREFDLFFGFRSAWFQHHGQLRSRGPLCRKARWEMESSHAGRVIPAAS